MMNSNSLIPLFVVAISIAMAGCAERAEPKTAVDYNASGAASTPAQPQKNASTAETTAPRPSPPPTEPPSVKYQGVECEYNGETVRLSGGETFTIKKEQQFYCYSLAAAVDCSNVSVSGMSLGSKAGICQIGFLPIEQKISGTREVSINIAGAKISFKIQVSGGSYKTASFRDEQR